MKQVAIFLTAALFGVMGWLMMDARHRASTAQLQLELFKQQQANRSAGVGMEIAPPPVPVEAPAAPVAAAPAAPAPKPLPQNALELAVKEKELLESKPSVDDLDPNNIPPPMGTPGMQVADPQAVAAAPAPEPSLRQRLVSKATVVGKVQEYVKEHAFIVVTPQPGVDFAKGTLYSIRRGDAVIGKIKVVELEEGNVIADLDTGSVAPGVDIVVGDEIIQDLGGNP